MTIGSILRLPEKVFRRRDENDVEDGRNVSRCSMDRRMTRKSKQNLGALGSNTNAKK